MNWEGAPMGSHNADYASQGLFLAFRSNAFWPSLLLFGANFHLNKQHLNGLFWMAFFFDSRWWSVLLFAKLEEGLLFHKTAPWDFLTVHKSPRGSSVSTLSVKKWTNRRADGSASRLPRCLWIWDCFHAILWCWIISTRWRKASDFLLIYFIRRRYRVIWSWYLLTIISNGFYLFLPSYLFCFSPNASWILSEPHCALEKWK